MADTSTRNLARTRAQNHFAASEQRDSLVKQIIAADRAALDARSAKLRALRLAQEEVNRETARIEALNAPKIPPAKKRTPRVVAKAVAK